MNQEQAVKLIDDHKNKLVDPVAMLQWVALRVIVNNVDKDAWAAAADRALEIMSR